MNESLTRRISWGAKQTSTAAIVSSPNKKVDRREDITTSDDEDLVNEKQNGELDKAPGSIEASGTRRRRESVYDFVGNGTDVENYEDHLQVAYQDETDMEDAFGAEEEARAAPADETEGTDQAEAGDAGPPSTQLAVEDSGTDHVAPPRQVDAVPEEPHEPPTAHTRASVSETASGTENSLDTPSKISIPKKERKHKKRSSKTKEKPMEAVMETSEESTTHDDSVSANQVTSSPAVLTPATSSLEGSESPSRKKSMNPFRGLLKRFQSKSVTSKSSIVVTSAPRDSEASSSASAANVAVDGPSDTPTTSPSVASESKATEPPRSPRSKHDMYDATRAELRTYLATEKTYLNNLGLLLEEWLLPAQRAAVPIDHVAALAPPVEQMVAAHSDLLRAVEKRLKDVDHLPLGTLFDDLLAEVSNAYKVYRSKQVLLLSLLDSSPTEKSMVDHAAISNWLSLRTDQLIEQGKDVSPLLDLLMEPMHHLAGLAYMLERLSEVVPKAHPDLPNVRKAAARVHLLHNEISSRGTTYRSMAKLSEIDTMLEFPPGVPSFMLADESAKRSYLLEGGLSQLELLSSERSELRKIHLFLFNDLALVCKEVPKDPTLSTVLAPRKTSSIREMITRRASGGANNSSSVVSPASSAGGHKYLVLSRLKLDRIFLVDPEDTHGELTTFTNAKAASSKSKSVEQAAEGLDAPELADYESLLEVVDMGVGIIRWRFASPEDKRLWLDTFNGALASVKPAFNVNERKYLYKLLLTQDIPPFTTQGDALASWPAARFLASLASRQLVERMHSTSFATANSRSTSTLGGHAATEGEMAVIKQEVANLKREHQRQLNDLTTRHEVDQAEIVNLHKLLSEKDSMISAASSNVASTSSASPSSSKKKKRGERATIELSQAEARAEEYRAKYLELMTTVTTKEKREEGLLQRLEASELAMKEQNNQVAQTLSVLNASIESNRQEMAEMHAVRKQMLQQQQMLQGLLEQLLAVSFKTEKPPILPPQPTLPRTNSIGTKPPVPAKGVPSTPGKPVVTTGPSWRGSAPAQHSPSYGSTQVPGSPGSSPASSIPGAHEKPLPNPALSSLSTRGKRASSQSLVVATPDAPVETVADSSESSNSAPGRPQPGAVSSSGSTPSLFGSSGKSPSRLNLSASQTVPANGAAPPLSPSSAGRGKERKLKNVVYKNGEETKPGWMRKLGIGSPKPRRDDSAGPASAPWRQPPSTAGPNTGSPSNGSDAGAVTIKKQNKVDWSQTRAEAYFSDDLGSDYDPAMHMSPSDFERMQDERLAPDGDNSDYSDENAP